LTHTVHDILASRLVNSNREWSLQEHIFLQHPLFECLDMMTHHSQILNSNPTRVQGAALNFFLSLFCWPRAVGFGPVLIMAWTTGQTIHLTLDKNGQEAGDLVAGA